MCGAKRSEAKPPTIRLRRLKNFPQGTPGRAQKQNSGFHKDLIQGVFSVFSPGHLPKKPSPFTDFFSEFSHFTNLFTAFGCCLFFRKPNNANFFSSKIPQKFKPSPFTEKSPVHLLKKKPSPFIHNLFFSVLVYFSLQIRFSTFFLLSFLLLFLQTNDTFCDKFKPSPFFSPRIYSNC